MNTKIAVIFCFSLVVSFQTVYAEGEGPCANDRKNFCSGVEQGEGRVAHCMKENKDKVSAECKAFMDSAKQQMKETKEACHADAEKLCPGMKKRGLMKCLRNKKDEVSESCKKEWQDMKELRKKKK